jgi:hypothetical protein
VADSDAPKLDALPDILDEIVELTPCPEDEDTSGQEKLYDALTARYSERANAGLDELYEYHEEVVRDAGLLLYVMCSIAHSTVPTVR